MRHEVLLKSKRASLGRKSMFFKQTGSALFEVILFVGILCFCFYYAASIHVANTEHGLKLYDKEFLTFKDTYVDVTKMNSNDLENHEFFVKAVRKAGDEGYLPKERGLLDKLAETKDQLAEKLENFDSNYRISDSVKEIGRLTGEKIDAIDSEYRIQEKLDSASREMKDKAKDINDWLKSN